MNQIVNNLRYDTQKSDLIAEDEFRDGNNRQYHGRNKYLYRTKNGNYFLVTETVWQGERDSLEPVSEKQAAELYETILVNHNEDYEDAFPNIEVKDA